MWSPLTGNSKIFKLDKRQFFAHPYNKVQNDPMEKKQTLTDYYG